MLTLEQRVRPDPEVVDTEVGPDEVALLHLGTKQYFSLNATGLRIWRGLKEGLTLQAIVKRLQDEFAVDAERAERSVLRLVDELIQADLVKPPEQPVP